MMFLRILKRDIKRKKTMNTILFLFIVLAAMFMASGTSNVITVMNGLDNYLDEAGIGDYNILTMGDHAVGALDEMLATTDAVKDYRMEEVVYASQKMLKHDDGTDIDYESTTGALLLQTVQDSFHLYDADNEMISSPPTGEAYVSPGYLNEANLEVGDRIKIKHEGAELSLTIRGICKDAFLGGAIVGNRRVMLSEEDYKKLTDVPLIRDSYRGQTCYIDTDDTKAIKSALVNVTNVAFDGDRALIKMTYLMDVFFAILMLIMSVCLIIVSLIILRFNIRFTIEEEFREIGVMKAIGIKNIKIRSLYIIKYLAMAIIGSAAGFGLSIPFGNMLLKESAKTIMLKSSDGLTWNIIGAFGIVLICLLFGFLFTRRVKKYTPIDAIRSGMSGERFKKKNRYHLRKTHLKPGGYMALNDVISAPKRFVTIILTFLLCMILVLVMVNISSTMRSDTFADTFGTVSDLYVMDTDKLMKLTKGEGENAVRDSLDALEKELADHGLNAKLCIEILYKYPLTFKGKDYSYTFSQGVGTGMEDYSYIEGTAPKAADEIAITPAVGKFLGAGIGDRITVHFADRDIDCMVTQEYETMNNMGELIRLHPDAPTDLKHVSSLMGIQINFDDDPDKETIEERKEIVSEILDSDQVMNAEEYCVDCMKAAPTMESIASLLLIITLVVVILVTILTERSLIAGEVTQIAILKAIGFSNGAVRRWHMWRFAIVGVVAMVLAAALSIPVTKLVGNPIFGMIGKPDVSYKIDILKTFLLYPGVVLVVTVLTAVITGLYMKKITARDTANIE